MGLGRFQFIQGYVKTLTKYTSLRYTPVIHTKRALTMNFFSKCLYLETITFPSPLKGAHKNVIKEDKAPVKEHSIFYLTEYYKLVNEVECIS